jgi:putative DNA primase/helicase
VNQTKLKQINLFSIPPELKNLPYWVCWKSKEIIKGEKPTKIPINPNTGEYAKSNDPLTWGTFEDALKFYKSNGKKIDGIGFVVSSDDLFTGIDLDHCRNSKNGEIESWAVEIIKATNSYTEITPSDEGIRIFVKGKVPKGRKKANIEVYSSGRFFTVTGNHLEGTPTTIESRQPELDSFYRKYFGNDKPQQESIPKPSTPTSLTDQELIGKATHSKNGDKFKKLMEGDFSDYPSWSEADLALCSMVTFWTGDNSAQIDRIFRQSGLMRDKWDEKHGASTYGQMTIKKAIEGTTEFYTPSSKTIDTGTTTGTFAPMNRNRQPRNVVEDLKMWIENAYGNFTSSQIYNDLNINAPDDKNKIRVALHRLVESEDIERGLSNGTFRKVDRKADVIVIEDNLQPALNLKWPGGIEEHVKIMPKSTIGVAGGMNDGKTAYLLNVAWENRNFMPTFYFTSEFGAGELRERLEGFGYQIDKWKKITFMERSRDFQDVINSDGLNVIDYLEVSDEGEFYKMGIQIKKIYEKLKMGIAVIGLQKKFGSEFGYGGQMTADKPRLYISLDKQTLKIVKAKLWATDVNPNGMYRTFKLVKGAKFLWNPWVKPPM